ncbi:helix-turn-helix domain-containing protein [Magnetospirillum molischianum]|uniref:helix-turn-helix domain-containing protein n=1 Tax=Magnetospirillum molischianum TaxID=1083 RepID=UPI0012DCABF4|nr:helix-turn-helix transcriptional regulator [Magnetospirillum molischianum]
MIMRITIPQNSVHSRGITDFCAHSSAQGSGTLQNMSKRPPKIEPNASDLAKKIHAFMLSEGLTMRGWGTRAGVSPNLLSELFSGRTRSITHIRLIKLARAVDKTPADIVGGDVLLSGLEDDTVPVSSVFKAVASWAASYGISDPAGAASAVVGALLDQSEGKDNSLEQEHPSQPL